MRAADVPLVPLKGRAVRVLVVDDHPATRQALIRILRGGPDILVVGEAGDGKVAVDRVSELRPEV